MNDEEKEYCAQIRKYGARMRNALILGGAGVLLGAALVAGYTKRYSQLYNSTQVKYEQYYSIESALDILKKSRESFAKISPRNQRVLTCVESIDRTISELEKEKLAVSPEPAELKNIDSQLTHGKYATITGYTLLLLSYCAGLKVFVSNDDKRSYYVASLRLIRRAREANMFAQS